MANLFTFFIVPWAFFRYRGLYLYRSLISSPIHRIPYFLYLIGSLLFRSLLFFYAILLAFVSLIFNICLSSSSIASHVSGSTIKHPIVFFDRFFLFAAAVLIKSNSCLLIRAWATLSYLAAISTFFRLGGLPPNQISINLGPLGGHFGGR
jgi:hypothetical protein